MEKFVYRAKRGLEEIIEGVIDADTKEEAVSILLERGVFPVSIIKYSEAQQAQPEAIVLPVKVSKKIRKKISSKEILGFTRQLATLIRAKVELLSSLRILYEQTDNLKFQEVILDINTTIKEGKTFSEALSHHPNVFSSIFISIIKAGEASGRLDTSLEQISEFMYREESLKAKIYVALAYPALLLFVGFSSIFVLINFVIPKLKPIFESIGKELPLITKVILNFSTISGKNVWITLTVIAGFIFFSIYTPQGKKLFKKITDFLKRNTPVVKRLTKNQELAHFSRALAMLLRGGVPALRSLEISTPSIGDARLREQFKKVCYSVAAGKGLSKSMEAYTSLPVFFTKMIAVGEESGSLAGVLDEISQSYTEQIESDIALLTSLIEPVLILILGLILGTIVLAILLPTFQITQMVR